MPFKCGFQRIRTGVCGQDYPLALALQGPIMQLVFHITHFEPRDVEQESLIETFRKLFPVHVPDPAAAEDVTRNS